MHFILAQNLVYMVGSESDPRWIKACKTSPFEVTLIPEQRRDLATGALMPKDREGWDIVDTSMITIAQTKASMEFKEIDTRGNPSDEEDEAVVSGKAPPGFDEEGQTSLEEL